MEHEADGNYVVWHDVRRTDVCVCVCNLYKLMSTRRRLITWQIMFDRIVHYKRQNNFVNEQLKHTRTHIPHTLTLAHTHTSCNIKCTWKMPNNFTAGNKAVRHTISARTKWSRGSGEQAVRGLVDSALALSFGRNANVPSSEPKKKKRKNINMQMWVRHSCRLDMKSLMCEMIAPFWWQL